MATTSALPRQQRKAGFEATIFERHRRMAVPLSKELRNRYGRRAIPVRKGDTVMILSGSYKGREERVAKVDLRGYAVTLDNVTGKTADAKLKPLSVRPSHLLLTRLALGDPWRRRILKVAETTEREEDAESPPAAPSGASETKSETEAPAKKPSRKSKASAKPKEETS